VNIFDGYGSDRKLHGAFPHRQEFSMAPTTLSRNKRDPNSRIFPGTFGKEWEAVTFLKNQTIFTQGDAAGTVFYIQKGKVRHAVVSRFGKEAILDTLGKGEFFGDGGLAGRPFRMGSAIAITGCRLLRIDKEAMMLALNRERAFSDLFVAYLLARNTRYHEKLVDQLFDSSEIRLARVLLLLARFGKESGPETVIPKVSEESLAKMVGTTCLRVRFFMNKFRKAGSLAYGRSGLSIHSSLLNVILHNPVLGPSSNKQGSQRPCHAGA
jgi:CRP-like cAMP-binding protein